MAENRLKINYQKGVKGVLNVIGFEDNGFQIAYCPALKLSGYGATSQEAIDMLLNVVCKDFWENLFALPEYKVYEELEKLGWVREKGLSKKQFNASSYVDKEGILRDFNLGTETRITERAVTVAA